MSRALQEALPEPVRRAVARHRVVLVVSPVTDTGVLERALQEQGRDWHRLELSMGSPEARRCFDDLRRVTGWRTLPQAFVGGAFVGGTGELMQALGQGAAMASMDDAAVRAWARGLGYAGLLPFAGLAASSWLAPQPWAAWSADALLAYGAVILSFIGALHWVRGLQGGGDSGERVRRLVVSVLPALVGWAALSAPPGTGTALLIGGFVLLYLYDRRAWRSVPWFLRLRSHLTAGAVAALALGWASSPSL